MTPQKMKILIKRFVNGNTTYERMIGSMLQPLLNVQEDMLIPTVQQMLADLRKGEDEFTKECTYIEKGYKW